MEMTNDDDDDDDEGMKLLPTGRKNVFYLTLCGSVISIFVLGIVVAGAALGYWIVRKFVISDDGSVDVGAAQFVKWAMRIIAATFIFQFYHYFGNSIYSANGNPWRSRGRANVRHNGAEFLSRSGMVASRGTLWNSPRRSFGWSDSPVKADISDQWEGDKKSTGLLFNIP